jgi:hypothetical protein
VVVQKTYLVLIWLRSEVRGRKILQLERAVPVSSPAARTNIS